MPRTGHFILHSNVMPRVTAGAYELLTEHDGVPFDVEPQRTHIRVSSPRYTMPTDQILSSFPPANAEGAFGDRLPQIVLKRRTLPWERNPAGGTAPSPTPWLALVVVAEGEAELSVATPVRACFTAGTPLLEPDEKDVEQGLYLAVTETVVRKIFPCREDLELLAHVREVDVNDTELANGDDDGWLAVVLANRLPVFDAARGKPVRYMACLLNLEGQLAALPPRQPPAPTFEFVLAQDWTLLAEIAPGGGPDVRVMGGETVATLAEIRGRDAKPLAAGATRRMAEGTTPSRAVGATLDGAAGMAQPARSVEWADTTAKVAAAAADPDAKQLVRDTMGLGFRLPIEFYAPETVLRFPVLAHWSFTTNEGATFETLMHDLDVGLLGTVASPADDPRRPEVVQTGHIGLSHRTRRGDATHAWYRGPLVPFPTARDAGTGSDPLALAHAADQLRRVIPDGREDLSLAAAFEIGRLLALSQLSVVSALQRFRAQQFGAGRVREVLAQLWPGLPALMDQHLDLGRFVALRTLETLAIDPGRVIGPRRPVADPGRLVRVDGDLDQLVADGLGIELPPLRQLAEQVGLVAALQKTPARLGLKPGQAPSEQGVLSTLQSALQGNLARTLGVAAPVLGDAGRPPTRGRAQRSGASRKPTPDALDGLMARAAARDDEEES